MHERLRSALRLRLAEVESIHREQPAPLACGGAVDAEESLRVVMVRLLPRAAADVGAHAAVLSRVCDLYGCAMDGDLRHLDAWNATFEITRSGPASAERERFLAYYAGLLRSWIARPAA